MQKFVKQLAAFRRSHPVLRSARHFDGRIDPATGRADVSWFDLSGAPMSQEMWHTPDTSFFAAMINNTGQDRGPGSQNSLLFLFNTSSNDIAFPLSEGEWSLTFDTSRETGFVDTVVSCKTGESFPCHARSVACLVLEG
ncbi:MAG: hypothetical protein WCN98_01165 [Verrucomicrobiaceae bacterium]